MKPNLEKLHLSIAEKLNWTHCHATGGLPCGLRPGRIHEENSEPLPPWLTSAGDALELVEWMAKPESGEYLAAFDYDRDEWTCIFINKHWELHRSVAQAFTLAICLAFAKANGIEIEYHE